MSKKQLICYINEEEYDLVIEIAQYLGISNSAVLRLALLEYLRGIEKNEDLHDA